MPLQFAQGLERLVLNLDTGAGGSCRVEIQDAGGAPLPDLRSYCAGTGGSCRHGPSSPTTLPTPLASPGCIAPPCIIYMKH